MRAFVILFVALIAGVTGNFLFDAPIVAGMAVSAAGSILLPSFGVALTVFTAPGGIAAPFSFNMTYIPQFLQFNNVVPLTSLKVETAEDGVLFDLAAAGITAVNGFLTVGTLPANDVVLRLANGEIQGKNVTVSGVTSAAGAIAFNASSDAKGTAAFTYRNAAILALNPTEFKDFTAIFLPTMAAGDTCEIAYDNGHKQTYNAAELAANSAIFQEASGIIVPNINANVHRVKFECVAARTAYVMSILRR